MHSQTISRILSKHGLFRRVAAKKPLLSYAAKEKRLLWAQHSCVIWPLWKWRRVIFSDENIFRTENNRLFLRVTRATSERIQENCIQITVKHGIQIHVWGVIGWNGPRHLKMVRGNRNALKYRTEIHDDLQARGKTLIPAGRTIIFKHDFAPAHNARTTPISPRGRNS